MTAYAANSPGDQRDQDPDRLDQSTLTFVADAAALLRNATVVRDEAVEAVVRRVKAETVIATVLSTIGGSMARVARATPELLGLIEEDR